MPNLKAMDRTQQDIRRTFQAIVATVDAARRKTSSNKRGKQSAASAPKETIEKANNSFARDLFFENTNIFQIAAEKNIGRSEQTVRHYANTLFERYVNEPAQRIRDPLHLLRFSNRETEGLLRMTLSVPFHSAEEVRAHKQKLTLHGIRAECYVDMTEGNTLLEIQDKVIAKLKRRFSNWPGKLDKLTTYLESGIQKRGQEEGNVLLEQLRYHSSFSDNWECFEHYANQMLDDLNRPNENRILRIWGSFQFEDDALNRKYRFGNYCLTRSCPRIDISELSCAAQDNNDTVSGDTTMHSETPCRPTQAGLPQTEAEDRLSATEQDHGASVNSVETVPAVAEPIVPEETPQARAPPVPYTLNDIKQKTNVRELLTKAYYAAYKIKKTWTDSEMERIIRRYYRANRKHFLAGRLPESLRILTSEEQEALQNTALSQTPVPQDTANPGTQEPLPLVRCETTEPIPSTVESQSSSPIPTTSEKRPKTNVVPSRKRPIVYDSITDSETESPIVEHPPKRPAVYLEDSITGLSEYIGTGSPAPIPISDTVNIQSSINFEPPIFSTQNVVDEELAPVTREIVAQNEPELWVHNPSPSDGNTSMSVTIAHIDELCPESPETVILVSPETPTLIKREPQAQSSVNYSDREGSVELVPLEPAEIIVLDDSASITDDESVTYEPVETVTQPRSSPTSPTMSRVNELFRLSEQDGCAVEQSPETVTAGTVGNNV
ncbi:uncharacterized protein LOC118460630 isoform X2 [Anopheles albimanus]|uniref:uncharacterized protein LOC118460630 isoform X2 n=1 Tax=Anopheles albimanus TaxID=7167 RepID=UPI00163E3CA0|nr:uncharacterized protein LOC118460630 isoform X2 [Anopheles albimanus]